MNQVISSLRVMQRMERFATEVYRTQVRAFPEQEIAERLKAAAANEREHADTLRGRIEELRETPSQVGVFYQMAGTLLGFITTLVGKLFILKTDIWIEKRAVKDYSDFLQKVDFDEKSAGLLHRIIGDEKRHIETWENSIEILKGQPWGEAREKESQKELKEK